MPHCLSTDTAERKVPCGESPLTPLLLHETPYRGRLLALIIYKIVHIQAPLFSSHPPCSVRRETRERQRGTKTVTDRRREKKRERQRETETETETKRECACPGTENTVIEKERNEKHRTKKRYTTYNHKEHKTHKTKVCLGVAWANEQKEVGRDKEPTSSTTQTLLSKKKQKKKTYAYTHTDQYNESTRRQRDAVGRERRRRRQGQIPTLHSGHEYRMTCMNSSCFIARAS